MINLSKVTIEEQNQIFSSKVFAQLILDSKEKKADDFIEDFNQSPKTFDSCFEFSYDEISSKAKEQRKNTIINMLVSFGLIPSQED